jgi:site-specific recombinase XerC
VAQQRQPGEDRGTAAGRLDAHSSDDRESGSTRSLEAATIVPRAGTTTEDAVSVEKTGSRKGLPYKVRWKHAGVHHARRFATATAAERFDRRVKDLKAAGELHLLDEEPRGTITLRDYVYDVWWPDYAEVNLSDEGRASYGVQLDLRIIPKWGSHQLRHLRPGPIESWVSQLRKQGVGDPTIIKTLTVFRSILKRAERDEEIDRNPIPLVAKPKQARTREPRPIAPYYVELIRRHMLDPTARRDKRGRRHERRPQLDRHRDATLVSLLAYSGPRPESEALPLRWSQIGARTITYRATKAGRVKPRRTRLLAPLARDLAEFRIRCGRPGDDELVFGEWSGTDWDNWRERIFQPAAIAVGLPADTIPRDLRGSFASLLIFEGLNVLEVAPELGHKPSTCLDIYGRLFEEFDPSQRRSAVDVIREARHAVRKGAVPTGYPALRRGQDDADGASAKSAE